MKPLKLKISDLKVKTIDISASISEELISYFEIIVHGKHSSLFLAPESFNFQKILEQLMCYQEEYKTLIGFNNLVTKEQAKTILTENKVYNLKEGGIIVLKEFFKFHESVLDTFLYYKKKKNFYKGNELIYLAQSSICPCGKARFGSFRNCRYSLKRCRSLINSLSEERLGNFDIIIPVNLNKFSKPFFTQLYLKNTKEKLQVAKELQKKRKQAAANSSLMIYELKESLTDEVIDFDLIPKSISYRLLQSTLSVARSIADLDASTRVGIEHLEQAKNICIKPRRKIKELI